MHPNAVLLEVQQLYNVSERLDSLAEQHPLVSEALIAISGSVRNAFDILAMVGRSNRPGLDEIRTRVQGLRHEIENLRNADQQQRLSHQTQVSWDSQKQHEARVARMEEIKQELVKLGRGMKRN